MKKIILGLMSVAFVFGLASVTYAAAPNWDVSGSYVINVEYLSVNYPENLILTQTGSAITGTSLDTIPAGSFFTVTGGTVSGNTVTITANQGSLVVDLSGTIALDGTMSGTWGDEAPGTRTGTWTTASGSATSLSVPPTDKDQCKDNGWKTFNNPSFSDKKECEQYVDNNDENGKTKGKITASPNQKIEFKVSSKTEKKNNEDKDKGNIEYWNYDYAGGTLHYKAKALCVAVESSTKTSRFMYQIPEGWPGLSGLYVIMSVHDGGKDGVGDTFAFTSSWDLPTATNTCENGGSFGSYPITGGDIKIK